MEPHLAPVPRLGTALWSAGSLEGLARPTVAVVGTRAATAYGRRVTADFAGELARAGCCVVSGLALGIDAAAHRAALEAGGVTVGVLGSGHRQFFPRRNEALAAQMVAAGGAVLSPFEPDTEAKPWNFLQRNGIVAALADAVVVIEAPARSGALNTAGWAAGRIPVYAVPGDVDRAHVAGCHALIRDGAILARSARDVLDDLRISSATADAKHDDDAVSDPLQRKVLGLLRSGECGMQALLDATGSEPAAIAAALSLLELRGAIEARPGAVYALMRR